MEMLCYMNYNYLVLYYRACQLFLNLSFLTDVLLPENLGALWVACRTAHARTASLSITLQAVAPSRNIRSCQA